MENTKNDDSRLAIPSSLFIGGKEVGMDEKVPRSIAQKIPGLGKTAWYSWTKKHNIRTYKDTTEDTRSASRYSVRQVWMASEGL